MKAIILVVLLAFANGRSELYRVDTVSEEACATLANTTFTDLEQQRLPDVPKDLKHAEAMCVAPDDINSTIKFDGTALPSYLVAKP